MDFESSGQQQRSQRVSQSPAPPSLYDILGVDKTATIQQITKSFRKKAIKDHPDKGGDPQKYRTLTEAYQILKDPQKKDLYDNYGLQGVKLGRNPNDKDFGGFFHPFDSQFKGPKKCRPKLVQINITLEEAYQGKEVEKEITRMKICGQCEGKGGQDPIQCQKCTGRGFVEEVIMIGPGMMTKRPIPCGVCSSQGCIFEEEKRCKKCEGKKVVQETKTFTVKIQPGVPHQNDYIVEHEADEMPGLEAGDIYFRVAITPHQKFKRKGADLYITKSIPLLQALAGVTFTEQLLNDEKILISSLPSQIISNQEKRVVKNKGMPFFKSPESRGHLIITFEIIMPLFSEIEERKYYRLSHLLKQPINTFRNVEGPVCTLQNYTQQSKIRNQQEPQKQPPQCQTQ